MKKTQLLLIALVILLGTAFSCDDTLDDFDPYENPLTGKVDGEEWTYISANARDNNVLVNTLDGLLLDYSVQEPCAVLLTTKPHVSITIPILQGSYNLPSINNNVAVIFNAENGAKRLTATGGFIQIVAVAGREAIGFINATFDDENFVEGTFVLEICD